MSSRPGRGSEFGITRNLRVKMTDSYIKNQDLIIGVGDSLEFLKTIPSDSVRLAVSSPPYNIGKVYEERINMKDYLEYQKEVALQIRRILKHDGSLAWEVGNYVSDGETFPLDIPFYKIFKEDAGLKLRNRIIWRFEHGLNASRRLSGRYESILWFTKSDDYIFSLDPIRVPQKYPGKAYYKGVKKGLPSGNPLGKNPGDVWEMLTKEWHDQIWNIPNVKSHHPEKTSHPAQFPVELVQRLILALTVEEDIIMDPFGGVGSSAIAALSLNRRAISIDRDKNYSKIAMSRVQSLMKGTLKIRNIGTTIYRPDPRSKLLHVPESWETLKARSTDDLTNSLSTSRNSRSFSHPHSRLGM